MAAAFDQLKVDAITVHPYLGHQAMEPFLEREEKLIFVLCRTSNPGAGEFQDLSVDGLPLYRAVARSVAGTWNQAGNCGLVVGATYLAERAGPARAGGDICEQRVEGFVSGGFGYVEAGRDWIGKRSAIGADERGETALADAV